MPIKLHYWNMAGRGDIVRMLLGYLKQDYEFIPANPQTWAEDAKAIVEGGFHFPNLPMIEDGDFKLSETNAIMQYLSDKYGDGTVSGKNLIDKALVHQFQGINFDLLLAFLGAVYSPDYKTKIPETVQQGSKALKLIQKLDSFLQGKDFLLGYFTYADLSIAMTFQMVSNVFQCAEIENPMNTLTLYNHAVRVFALPGIKEWYESDGFKNQASAIPWIKMCDLVEPSD